MNNKEILDAIEKHNMIFLSAQPDTPYFHWQVELYLYQFAKHGIKDRCYALFGYSTKEPSDDVKRLQKMYPHVIAYKDERKNKLYTPSIRPHIYKKFFKDNPELGKNVFIHDSDIFIITMPNFKKLLEDASMNSYVSDTINYIGFDYIKNCCKRYKEKYKNLPELDLFDKMCESVSIDPELVKQREKQSGGAQYLFRNQTYEFWDEVEEKETIMYQMFCDYVNKYPINKHIQKWTTDMWVSLWLYWKAGNNTIITDELSFSWATHNIDSYKSKPIFHLAGVTSDMKRVFYKGAYNNKSVFEEYNKNRKLFNDITPTSATKCYTDVIKEYFNEVYCKSKGYQPDDNTLIHEVIPKSTETSESSARSSTGSSLTGSQGQQRTKQALFKKTSINNSSNNDNNQERDASLFGKKRFNIVGCKKFRITCDKISEGFNGVYVIDLKKKCCDKFIWRTTDGKYIIYHNGKGWISTYSGCEKSICKGSGGLASNKSDEPYYNNWNVDCMVEILCD